MLRNVIILLSVWVVTFSGIAEAHSPPADLILLNGKIFTSETSHSSAEALAIEGERISAVGSNADIKKLIGKNTRTIDLKGMTVVPGFNDAHSHFGPTFQGIELKITELEPTWLETIAALKAAVASTTKGKWIFATVGGAVINEQEASRATLDSLAPENPVLFSTYFGHGAIFNSKAMSLLGISETQADRYGGRFDRENNSKRLTGRMFEYAQWYYDRKLVEQGTDEQLIAELKRRAADHAAFGITSRQTMPGIGIERFVRLLNKADLPIRVRAIPFSLTSGNGREMAEIRVLRSLRGSSSMVTVSGIKWILDGTPIERGAALNADYKDKAGWKGQLNFSEVEIKKILRESLRLNQQILLHCVGDRACGSVLDAMDEIAQAGKVDWRTKRVRLEHAENVTGEMIDRAKLLGVVIVQNPTHFTDGELGRARWGSGKAPIRTYIEKGIPFALGSDGPANPFLNIMFAVIHPDNPGQAITREQAVHAYTLGAAFAEFTEKDKGSLAKGKLADLAVLSQDIFSIPVDALPGTTSVLTLVGGKIVHDAKILK